jgi:hypothetical protein
MYCVSHNAQEPIIDVDTVGDFEPTIRNLKAGRYDVDEMSANTLPSGYTSRRWVVGTK